MTTPNKIHPDELNDFMEGHDDLSRQLKQLKNHSDKNSPAQLDAAILSLIEESLENEKIALSNLNSNLNINLNSKSNLQENSQENINAEITTITTPIPTPKKPQLNFWKNI